MPRFSQTAHLSTTISHLLNSPSRTDYSIISSLPEADSSLILFFSHTPLHLFLPSLPSLKSMIHLEHSSAHTFNTCVVCLLCCSLCKTPTPLKPNPPSPLCLLPPSCSRQREAKSQEDRSFMRQKLCQPLWQALLQLFQLVSK